MTLFQYVLILANYLVFGPLPGFYKGAEISFTEQNPTYTRFKTMKDDPDINNLNCIVERQALIRGIYGFLVRKSRTPAFGRDKE